jgi:DNA polymerase-3 subunit alpha
MEGFYYKPRIDFELLEKHKEGLIISTACISGEIPSLILTEKDKAKQIAEQYRETFKDDFYIEIMTHNYYNDPEQQAKEKEVAKALYKLSTETGIKAICTQDAHYANNDQWFAHDVLLSIQTTDVIKNPNRLSFGSKDFYLKSYDEMLSLYKKVPSLLSNTVEIAEKIEEKLIDSSEDLLPDFILPSGFKTEEEYLKTLVKDGMKKRGLFDKPEYRARIKYEMDVIVKCKYTKYFLIIWDIINFARTNGIIIGAGRGSGVSSLCLYVLGVTQLDPLKYGLLFERFLNPERISPPDVDIDFDYFRREEVYNYIVRKYGADRCCQIGTYNGFKTKAVIRNVTKALDLGKDWEQLLIDRQTNPALKKPISKKSLDLAGYISKAIPHKAKDIADATKDEDFKRLLMSYPKLLECVTHIEGTLAYAGVHPAGIIVCKDPVIEHVPLRITKETMASQYTMSEVENIGLLKFDLLALKTLTVIDNTLKMVKERKGKEIDIDKLEPNDKKVFDILSGFDNKIDSKGVFQLESDGMSKLLRDIRVDSFEDIIVANALYRPGPLGSGMHEMYCNFKHKRRPVTYLHPKLEEVLKETFGIICFQEQIMKVAQHLAGFTMPQADSLRKGIGKKIKDILIKLEETFVNGCVKNNIPKDIATKIFEQIKYFADYGFNRSHAAAYSFISYQTCWLKKYYPVEYMCNLLTSEISNSDKNEKLNIYIYAAKRMDIIFLTYDLNKSSTEFKIEKLPDGREALRQPLTMLNGVGDKAVNSIIQNQPYISLDDFIRKVDLRLVNSKVINMLVENECMHTWCRNKDEVLDQYLGIRKNIEKEKKDEKKKEENEKRYGRESLFDFSGKDLEI